jgi:hypothetical protein
LLIEVLVPTNETSPTSFTLTGTLPGTATLVSTTAWTSGNLDTYLGISASPSNPFGAYLPSTQGLDPGATGFSVYQVDLGTTTLQDASNPNQTPLENRGQVLPLASYIVGFLNEGTAASPNWVATANSGAILETSTLSTATPEPSTMLIAALGVIGFGSYGWRRRKKA